MIIFKTFKGVNSKAHDKVQRIQEIYLIPVNFKDLKIQFCLKVQLILWK